MCDYNKNNITAIKLVQNLILQLSYKTSILFKPATSGGGGRRRDGGGTQPGTHSGREQHFLHVSHSGEVLQHGHVLVVRQLLHEDGLPLLPHPAAALPGAQQVDRAVALAVHHRGLLVGELVRVLEGLGRGDAGAVQAVRGHAGRREVVDQLLRVLAHGHAVGEFDAIEEVSVVADCVVELGRLD